MAEPMIPVKVKFFIGVITSSEDLLLRIEKQIVKKFGVSDFQTTKIAFIHTKYYDYIGTDLFKVLYSFKKLINRDKIIQAKLFTNKLEKKYSINKKRKINIDPGYLSLSNVYLASCKDYFHRIYLNKGIYLENELKYVNKKFIPWEWTYPDYQKVEYLDFFYNIRKLYHNQIRRK